MEILLICFDKIFKKPNAMEESNLSELQDMLVMTKK